LRGQEPHNHPLFHVETPAFYEVSQTHKRKGWFLYEELKKKKITGVMAGLTQHFKLNTYGVTWDQIKYAADVFLDIGEKYGILEE
jgi:Sep-tRNA:Cys-tRNA synthetase